MWKAYRKRRMNVMAHQFRADKEFPECVRIEYEWCVGNGGTVEKRPHYYVGFDEIKDGDYIIDNQHIMHKHLFEAEFEEDNRCRA